jgi:hypothetical protein
VAETVKCFFGLADRHERAAVTAVTQFGGQRFGRGVALGQLADGADGGQRLVGSTVYLVG